MVFFYVAEVYKRWGLIGGDNLTAVNILTMVKLIRVMGFRLVNLGGRNARVLGSLMESVVERGGGFEWVPQCCKA